MERLARLVMHHRRIVSAVWAVLFLGGLFSAGQLSDRWTFDFSLPGQPGDNAEQQLIETYGVSTFDTYVAIVTVPEGQTVRQDKGSIAKVFASSVAAVPDTRLRRDRPAGNGGRAVSGRPGSRGHSWCDGGRCNNHIQAFYR